MNKNLQDIYTYHDQTKHHPNRYAKSLGYMDWDTQPNPYRDYDKTDKIKMPLKFDNTNDIHYHKIFTNKNPQDLNIDTISQFFRFSLANSAIKIAGNQSWALRCNASSGNLHPSEAYIINNNIDGLNSGVYHYAPKNHELECLSSSSKPLDLPQESFLIAVSSIVWREAWKYGERSWRYTQLDCGHAWRALEISAFMLGWSIKKLDKNDEDISNLIGLNQQKRYIREESEHIDMLLLVSREHKNNLSKSIDILKIRNCFDEFYSGKANQLSPSWFKWDILENIENATKTNIITTNKQDLIKSTRINEDNISKDVVLHRRSAQSMDKLDSSFSYQEFETILSSVAGSLDEKECAINLVLFIHNVESLKSGIYILIRNQEHKKELQSLMKESFLWDQIESDTLELYLLEVGNAKKISKHISCNQDIASDGAFSLGMLSQFNKQLEKYGAHRYKELYWECGAIGQQLYLEATSISLSATGIGCFLDDIFHDLLELKSNHYQSLYHFTFGRAIIDTRLSTQEPY